MKVISPLVGIALAILLSVAPASATHFRGGTTSWAKDLSFSSATDQRITITLDTYWRWSFPSFGSPSPGATVQTGTSLTLSGNSGYSWTFPDTAVVVTVNQTEDWMVVRSTLTRDIPNTAFPVSATYASSSRPSALRETNNDQSFRLGTVIDTTLATRSPLYTGNAVYTLGVNQAASFQLPAMAFSGLTNTTIIAPSADSYLPQARPMGFSACSSGCSACYGSNVGNCVDGLSVSSAGVVSWTPQIAGLYAVQFRIISVDVNNAPKAAIPVDLLLDVQNIVVPTSTPTLAATGTPTDTPTGAPTGTATETPTDTPTTTPTTTSTMTPTEAATPTATATPTVTATTTNTPAVGFVPPDAATAKCEHSVASQLAKFFACTTKCKTAQASAASEGASFDVAACEQAMTKSCRATYNAKSAKLLAKVPALCPACLDAGAQGNLADLATGFLQNNNGLIYCAGTTSLGGGNTGVVPPDANTEECAGAVVKNLRKLSACVAKCEVKRAKAAFKAKSFDTTACKQANCRAKYNAGAVKLLGSVPAICPACLGATAQSNLADLIIGFMENSSSLAYCAGTIPLP